MRRRRSARLLVLDAERRVLLFRFVLKTGATAGQDFWATPGGALESTETFEEAAIRELTEETGIVLDDVGQSIASREFVMQMPDGEHVVSDERFFVVRAPGEAISRTRWTAMERDVMSITSGGRPLNCGRRPPPAR
jgi:8-oxo-dGTP diphosphatase